MKRKPEDEVRAELLALKEAVSAKRYRQACEAYTLMIRGLRREAEAKRKARGKARA